MPTKEKSEKIAELVRLLESSPVAILTDYRGLSVSDVTNLRGQLRGANVEFHVTKNTLTRLAAERLKISGLDPFLAGPTAIAFAHGDVAQAAKLIRDFARTSRILTVRGALVGRDVVGPEGVVSLSELPPKAQLQAQLAGNIQAPLAAMVGVLDSVLSSLIYTLDERARQEAPAEAA